MPCEGVFDIGMVGCVASLLLLVLCQDLEDGVRMDRDTGGESARLGVRGM